MIRCIVIDDEMHCLETMSLLLKEHCPDVNVAAICRSGQAGLEAIEKVKPELIFLDIEMPVMNGFEMLEQFSAIDFAIVFTTSYDQYAIKAIRFSALDYLLKPIDRKELMSAIRKVESRKHLPSAEQFKMLLSKVQNHNGGFAKIAVPTAEGFELIPVDTIIACEADDNYTNFSLKNQRKVIACRTLKEVEETLESFPSFIRVHHSYMVNLNEVVKYVRGEGGYLVMTNGNTVNVSRSRKEGLLRFLKI